MISKLQLNKSSIISKAENEKGIVLIGAIALVAILALLGTVAVVTTSTEIIISKNHKTGVQARYVAQAGTEEARARLKGWSSDSNYAGDPAANPDPTWSAYILTSSAWQTSDDPNYNSTYTNYIPTTSDHTNTTIVTNTIQAPKALLPAAAWVDTVGVIVNGNSMTKNASNGWGNGGAASLESITGDGGVEFVVTQTDTYRMCGLSSTNTDADYASIEYAIHTRPNGVLQVYENGTAKGFFGTYQIGDRFMVERVGNTIVYKQNDVIFYTSLIPTDEALFVDCSIFNNDGEISDVKLTQPSEPDIPYWVKIRHKREADLLPAEQYTDNGSGTNDIIYYGYEAPTSTTKKQFTTDADPYTASPVDIITSYASNGTSSGIIEVHASRLSSPPIVATVYGVTVEGAGNVTIIGNDTCSSNPIPAVAYVDWQDFSGAAKMIESDAGAYAQVSALEIETIVEQLKSTATITLTEDQTNYNVGSSSNYEVVYCDATNLSPDNELDLQNTVGYGTLAVKGDVFLSGTITWNGLIVATGNIEFAGGGTKEIYGAVMGNKITQLVGTVEAYYSSCDLDNANNSYRYTTLRWKDKTLN
jgi:hypothetical protein